MALKDPKQINAKRPAAQGCTPEPNPPTAEQPTAGPSPAQPASGHRVEAVNALALANQEIVSELQEIIAIAAQAQQNAAKQTAQAVKVLLNREYFYSQLNQELAGVIEEVRAADTKKLQSPFDSAKPKNLLPGWEKVVYEELKLLPVA